MSSDGQTSSSRPTEILLAQQSVFRIAGKASDVSINQQGIIQMAWDVLIYLDNAFQNGEFENVMCKFTRHSDLYPDCNDNRAADWIFVLHTLNFSLWSPKGTDPWTVNGYTGFLALCAAMKRAIMKGKPIWNPNYYKELFQKPEDVEIIFQSDNGTCIPMLKERVDLLHEIGKILTEYYKGTFVTCLKLHKNGIDLLILVARNFPSYQEKMVQYEGETVSFCLKAFLLIGDMVCFFHEHKEINIETIFPTTIFVDFRIIQLFLKYKALQYTDRLKKKIEENDTLEFGSTENLEIIACTYMIRSQLSVELLKLVKRHKTTNLNKQKLINEACTTNFEILIDNFLWYYRHAHDQYLMENVLLHNVRSLYF